MKCGVLESVCDAIIEKECIWIITNNLNSLLRYDFCRQELEVVAVYPEMVWDIWNPFSRIIKLENEIYFLPGMAKDIFCLDLTEKTFYGLGISLDIFEIEKKMDAVIYKRNIYCVNRCPDIVIKINSVSKKVELFSVGKNQCVNEEMERNVFGLYKEPCLWHGKIFWPNYNNILTIFDIEKERFTTEILEGISNEKAERMKGSFIGYIGDWIVGVRVYEDTLWLFSFEGKIYQYRNEIHKVEEKLFDSYIHYSDGDRIREYTIYDIVLSEGELWFIPSYKNKCITYSGYTEQYEEVLDSYVQNWEGYRRGYTLCKEIGGEVWLYNYFEKCFYILDLKKNFVYKRQLEISYSKLMKENYLFKCMMLKSNKFNFDDIGYLCTQLVVEGKGNIEKKTVSIIGKQIYENIT